jgi:DNA-binding response OmpR family regulator
MPMMNGFELCEKILQKDVSIKVCFMTAREVNMDAVREVHSKKYRLLHKKPISTHELIKRVKGELG